jgi:hypothetical protein
VEGEPLRRFAADSWQLFQFIDEPGHRLCKFGQGTSRDRHSGGTRRRWPAMATSKLDESL